MGFGTLFIGYFLLLNVTEYMFSDAIAAAVMLMGLNKLGAVNREFKISSYISIGFTVYGFAELVLRTLDLFGILNLDSFITYIAIPRYVIVCALTVAVLSGIYEVSREVELDTIPKRARTMTVLSFIVYVLLIALEVVPSNSYTGVLLFLVGLLSVIGLVIYNLVIIYTCYMKICMPGDENGKRQQPSRFGFVNEYRQRSEERARREAAERYEKYKKKQQSHRGKRK